jgi:UDP-N-acetylmuramoylalanine--D-glutamate ligase
VAESFLRQGSRELLALDSLPNLRGRHIFANLCGVLEVFREEGLDVPRALESLRNFKTLAHRLEIFYDDPETGTKFVDDSLSTIPEASLEALAAFPGERIFLILGGFDRQQDYSKIIEFLKNAPNVQRVFLLGQTGKGLETSLGNAEYFENLPDLVRSLRSQDLRNSTVILSPGAASYDMFRNFEDRGRQFKELMLSQEL